MRDMLWVSGDEGGGGGVKASLLGQKEYRRGEGGGMLISAVNAFTCNMDLIA